MECGSSLLALKIIINPGQCLHRAHVITTASGRNAIVLQRSMVHNQSTVQHSESTILLSMSFLLYLAVKVFEERSQFLSYKALNFSSNP